ncbi:MAG: site-specific DNA-methyltransferase [Actinomycetia bacterium]|nr:site-specific DNA-methyltransferase [Actinomycetes bacterium]
MTTGTAAAPYYADDAVTLYLGDCREITAWLAADVLVTDPPYGRAWRQGVLARPGRVSDGHAGIAGDADTSARDEALALWGGRPAIVFADLMLGPPPRARLPLIYAKPSNAGLRGGFGAFRRDIEGIYLAGDWPSRLGGRSAVLRTAARSMGGEAGLTGRYGHPHAKPVDVCEQLIAACPEGTVADPFAGSGSVLVAARNLGRRAIGVEIDEGYARAAALRLAQGVLL